jgi:hypothetical protein
MTSWSEEEVMEKLNEGWLLSGDVTRDAQFSLINPHQTRADRVAGIDVKVVHELHRKGLLVPEPVAGKKMMYRRRPQ